MQGLENLRRKGKLMIFNAAIVTKVKYRKKRCCLPLRSEGAFLFFDWITSMWK